MTGRQRISLLGQAAGGVWAAEAYTDAPGDEGVLERYEVEVPRFRRAAYYAAFQKYDHAGPRPGMWPWAANRCQALPVEGFDNLIEGGVLLLLALRDGGFMALLPVAGRQAVAWLGSENEALICHLGTLGTSPVQNDLPVLAWARADDPYTASREAWRRALSHPEVGHTTRMRCEKRYPEPFRYLGWCTWEEFRKDIDEQTLLDAARAIEESEVPVRYVLVDDGHLEADDRRLLSFRTNKKFPRGWKPLMALRRPDRLRWMGLWLNFNGYWDGISPDNDLGELNQHLMPMVEEHVEGALQPRPGRLHSLAFYDAMVDAAREAGFDFLKVDDQASNLRNYRGTEQPVLCAGSNSRALETACAYHVDGLINCMAHNNVCAFNTRVSAVTRCSEDYRAGDPERARRHLHNSYANILWLGHTVWGDHDMFHSNDPVSGQVMAVSKALSGGPVYLSDNPTDFVPEVVRPLCTQDGELLRPLAPAAPLPDSVFRDPFADGEPYRVIAPLPNRCAAVAAYNLTEPEVPVSGTIGPADYTHASCMMQPDNAPWHIPEEGLLLYDWLSGEAVRLEEPFTFKLEGYGHVPALLCPIRHSWAIVGRPDKYLSPAAVEVLHCGPEELVLRMIESGPLAVWSERGRVVSDSCSFQSDDRGLWLADLPVGERDVIVRCRRAGC